MEFDVIYNQDCLEGMKAIPDKSVDLIIADPPYLIDTRGGGICGKDGSVKHFREGHLDGMKDGFSTDILDECCRVMRRINIYLFCSQKQIIPLCDYFVGNKKCNWNLLSWHKSNPIPACGNKYLTDTEFILFFREKGVRIDGNYETKKTYYITPLNQAEKKLYGHPTIKPLEIVQNLICNSCPDGGIVLDPFIGSGTTAIAALNMGRHYIGYEINKDYFDAACKRLEKSLLGCKHGS